MKRPNVWPLQTYLSQGIWHTTHPVRFLKVMKDGALKVKPDLSEKERWKTSRGPDYHPLVRKIGGISLFDFTKFDPHSYSISHPMSSWHTFVPHQESWRGAVWIEIDYDAIAERFVSADQLVDRWKQGNLRHSIMPRIECACIGDISSTAFRSAFLTWSGGDQIRSISLSNEAQYIGVIQEWDTSLW